MAKKAPAKKLPAKRKPRPKKPVVPATPEPLKAPAWSGMIKPVVTAVIAALAAGGFFAAGIWSAGGIEIGPDGGGKQDAVSAVFDDQESAFRRLSGERAKALRAGELTSEKASADWMAEKFLPESDAAWSKLLTSEAEVFGGEKWTAEKEAAHIEGYAR